MLAVDQMIGEQLDIVRSDRRQFVGGGVADFEFPRSDGQRIVDLEGLQLDGRPGRSGIGHRVAAIAVGLALDELRSAAAANAIERLLGRGMDLEYVHAIDLFRRDIVGGNALEHLWHRRMTVNLGADRIVVVFADEQDRQVPKTGHVQRLVESALIDGPVAEEANDSFR